MHATRRTVLRSIAATATLPLLGAARPPARAPKRVLVLGGTLFVGPAIVEVLLARGHDVTLYNRGRTNPELFASTRKVRGDRTVSGDAGLAQLATEDWDVVIDTWPEDPRLVDEATALLADRAAHYVFVSTISVYDDYSRPGLTEDGSTWPPSDEHYGTRKAMGEEIVRGRFDGRFTTLRPGAILGPRKPSDSLRFWVVRLERGGKVLAPGTGLDPVQYTDVRDLGEFVVHTAEQGTVGTFNTLGPKERLTMAELVGGCKAVTSGEAEVVWVSEEFLREQRVRSWGPMPLWAPLSEDPGFCQIDPSRALAAGYRHRPLAETASASLAWFREAFPPEYDFGTDEGDGISRARELELLEAWERG